MRARPGGGFNQGMGNFGEAHMEEQAMQQAMQQKTASQQSTSAQSSLGAGMGGNKAQTQQQQAQAMQQMAGGQQPGQAPAPREVGTIPEEASRVGTDIFAELKKFFSINTWLGVKPETDDPQEIAKRKQVHQRWQKLNAEQQEVAKKKYQEDLQRKKAEEEEKERKKQMEEQQKAQQIQMPSSPKKGAVGPGGSKKQKATQKLQNDRKQLSGPSSAN